MVIALNIEIKKSLKFLLYELKLYMKRIIIIQYAEFTDYHLLSDNI